MNREKTQFNATARLRLMLGLLGLAGMALLWRGVYLHVFDHNFLASQGNARYLRVVNIAAHRGMLTDRNGEPLAISTPVESVWANPQVLAEAQDKWGVLAKRLGLDIDQISHDVTEHQGREFVYLRRLMDPELAEKVMALNIPGVSLQREFRRYYPAGEVTAHVIGFTNVDDVGQEGLELAWNSELSGIPGSKRVLKDRLGRIVENVESISEPRPGKDIALSIDKRIQYIAYRELKAAVVRNKAKSGSVVVLDVHTGEVLAMVNQPSYNPNNRRDLNSSRYRNRAVTDVLEPGSTMKPFTILAALQSGKYTPDTMVDTRPGTLRLGGFTIRDAGDFGVIDVADVIRKSSNVGASKIALSLDPERLWDVYTRVGFGFDTGSGFPGEVAGLLKSYQDWRQVDQAAISYGYGISVTPLQLAHAYAVIGNGGHMVPVSFRRLTPDEVDPGRQVFDPQLCGKVVKMMEGVVEGGGTGTRAEIPGYKVAGKTGTVRMLGRNGYSEDRYRAVFAGLAPATHPRLAMVVVIDDPAGNAYYGGLVAAPVFAKVMGNALRLLDIPPDDLHSMDKTTIAEASQ